jgi:two-component system chemotaxis response regulator CheB
MAAGRRTRILIVDDSAVMRSLLRSVVTADAALEVAGTAADGASALSSLATLQPDLILLDVEMPVMDGLVTLRELRRRGHKMPVIMCSSLTQRGAKVTLEALAGGASDYVAKPRGQENREAAIKALGQDLSPKDSRPDATRSVAWRSPFSGRPGFRAATRHPAPNAQPVFPGVSRPPLFPAAASQRAQNITSRPTVLVIGVSTGGPAALDVFLPCFRPTFPCPC